MTSSLRLRMLFAGVVLAALPLVASACNAQLATVLSANDGGSSGASSSGGAACTVDAECNADPSVSSLRGACVGGKCVCAKGVAVTADGKCGDIVAGPDGSSEPSSCEAKGGTCIPEGSSAPPTLQPDKTGLTCTAKSATCWVPIVASGAPVCSNDAGCNEDPSISALLGTCTFGICVCNTGTVQPSGKCAATPPPECLKQAGTCRQMPATCNAGELASYGETNLSCGDFVEVVCCLPGSSCKGGGREVAGAGWVPVDFYCCSPSKVQSAPLCINGWRTCAPGHTPTANPGGGC
ncbi:MAG: hypothetical protein JST00_34705 [Deltaproteobacteria bacterium]|nr:hypothetical protein [Deltaproteobacteria bacterium]